MSHPSGAIFTFDIPITVRDGDSLVFTWTESGDTYTVTDITINGVPVDPVQMAVWAGIDEIRRMGREKLRG